MKNYERLNNVYTDLCVDLETAVNDLGSATTYEAYDEQLKTIDALTVILKRMGETSVLEVGEQHNVEVDIIEEVDGDDEGKEE